MDNIEAFQLIPRVTPLSAGEEGTHGIDTLRLLGGEVGFETHTNPPPPTGPYNTALVVAPGGYCGATC